MGAKFSDLQQRVKYATRQVASGETVPQMIKDTINMVYLDCIIELKPSEFLFPRLEMGAAGGILLPPDYIEMSTVSYKDVSNSNREHRLIQKDSVVPPAPIFGLPRWYQITGSNLNTSPNISQMIIRPDSMIDSTNDKIYLTYWKAPEPLVEEDDELRSSWLDTEVVKRAIYFVHTYSNDIPKAQAVLAMSLKRMGQQAAAAG